MDVKMILYVPPIEANGVACFDVRQAQSLRPCCDGSGCYFESPGEFGFGDEFVWVFGIFIHNIVGHALANYNLHQHSPYYAMA
jgi:hypothetical protein